MYNPHRVHGRETQLVHPDARLAQVLDQMAFAHRWFHERFSCDAPVTQPPLRSVIVLALDLTSSYEEWHVGLRTVEREGKRSAEAPLLHLNCPSAQHLVAGSLEGAERHKPGDGVLQVGGGVSRRVVPRGFRCSELR